MQNVSSSQNFGFGVRVLINGTWGFAGSPIVTLDEVKRVTSEAVAIANDTVYGLGAHVQGRDMDAVRDVASRIRAGQVHLNYPAWDPHAPFGGFKQSGNGREYGVEGMREYLEVKSILGYF